MRIKQILLILFCCLLVNLQALAAPGGLNRRTELAVMDFGTRPNATSEEISINNAQHMSCDYIIHRLVDDNLFFVKEKELVLGTLKKENLDTVGLIDPDTAKRIGKLLNVKYLLYGNITGVSFSSTGVAIIGGGVDKGTVKAHIIGRIMDVDTGDILVAAKGDGKSDSSYTKIPGVLGGTVSFGTYKVTQDAVHNAIMKAAFNMVDHIDEKFDGKKAKE